MLSDMITNLLLCAGLFAAWVMVNILQHSPLTDKRNLEAPYTLSPPAIEERIVAVLYAFSDTDPEYTSNLEFFVAECARQKDKSDYYIIINTNGPLPQLPPLVGIRAKYLLHENVCFDWGAFGWAIRNGFVRVTKYTHFVFVNSSVRGPFVPTYVRESWTQLLLSALSDDVKLVGPTISCEAASSKGLLKRNNPHVQSYTVGTDRIGLGVLLQSDVFECRDDIQETIFYSELGVSKAILDAGYNIASLMTRYVGVDWRNMTNWQCNSGANPYVLNANDGASLEAFEVMFVKVKGHLLQQKWPYMVSADKVTKWKKATVASIATNDYVTRPAKYQLPHKLVVLARGMDCFDCEYYIRVNLDIPRTWSCVQAFNHYVNTGSFEGRKARYTCDFDESRVPTRVPIMGQRSSAQASA